MLATGGDTVKLWDLTSYQQTHQISANNGKTVAGGVSWNNDGRCIANLCEGSPDVCIFNVSGSSCVLSKTVRPMENPKCLEYTSLSPKLVGVAGGNSVLVWDVISNSQMKYYGLKESGISSLAFSHKDTHIACGTKQGNAYLLSVSNNSISAPIQVFKDKTKVNCLKYSYVSRSIIGAGSDGGSIGFIDSNTSKIVHTGSAHGAPITGIAFSPCNSLLFISVGLDKKLNCHNLNTKSPITNIKCNTPLTSCSFLYDGHLVALGSMTGELIFHDLRMLGVPVKSIQAYSSAVTSINVQNIRSVSKGNSAKKSSVSSSKTAKRPVTPTLPSPNKNLPKTPTPTKMAPTIPDRSESPQLLSPIRSSTNVPVSPINSIEEDFTHRLDLIESKTKDPISSTGSYDELLSPVRSPSAPRCMSKFDSHSQIPPVATNTQNIDLEDLLSPIRSSESTNKNNQGKTNKAVLNTSPICSPVSERKTINPQILINDENKENITSVEKHSDSSTERAVLKEKNIPNDSSDIIKNTIDSISKPSRSLKKSASKVSLLPNISEGTMILERSSDETVTPENKKKVTFANEVMEKSYSFNNVSVDSNSSNFEKRLSAMESSFKNMENLFKEMSENFKQSSRDTTPDLSKFEPPTAQNLQLELVKSCVRDVMDEHQMENNKRFIHLHWIFLNMFYDHEIKMEELIKTYSINEELVKKCEELQEENRRLRSLY